MDAKNTKWKQKSEVTCKRKYLLQIQIFFKLKDLTPHKDIVRIKSSKFALPKARISGDFDSRENLNQTKWKQRPLNGKCVKLETIERFTKKRVFS